jgi:hypothetical protein
MSDIIRICPHCAAQQNQMFPPLRTAEDAYAWSKQKVLALADFQAAVVAAAASSESRCLVHESEEDMRANIPQGESCISGLREEIERARSLRKAIEDDCRRAADSIKKAEAEIHKLTRQISDAYSSFDDRLEELDLSKHVLLGGGGALEELRSLGPSPPSMARSGGRTDAWMRLDLPPAQVSGLSGYVNGTPVHLFPSPSMEVTWPKINFGWSCMALILQSLLRNIGSNAPPKTLTNSLRDQPFDIVVLRGCALLTRRGSIRSRHEGRCVTLALRGGHVPLLTGVSAAAGGRSRSGGTVAPQHYLHVAADQYLPAVAALSIMVVYLVLRLDRSTLLRGALARVEEVVHRYGTEVIANSTDSGGGEAHGARFSTRRVDLLPHWRFLFAPSPSATDSGHTDVSEVIGASREGGTREDASPIMSDIIFSLRELMISL